MSARRSVAAYGPVADYSAAALAWRQASESRGHGLSVEEYAAVYPRPTLRAFLTGGRQR